MRWLEFSFIKYEPACIKYKLSLTKYKTTCIKYKFSFIKYKPSCIKYQIKSWVVSKKSNPRSSFIFCQKWKWAFCKIDRPPVCKMSKEKLTLECRLKVSNWTCIVVGIIVTFKIYIFLYHGQKTVAWSSTSL